MDQSAQAADSERGAFSRMYNFVRARQPEGAYLGEPKFVNWVISSARIMRGWGIPSEAD
jgi:hypothetical protein